MPNLGNAVGSCRGTAAAAMQGNGEPGGGRDGGGGTWDWETHVGRGLGGLVRGDVVGRNRHDLRVKGIDMCCTSLRAWCCWLLRVVWVRGGG